MYGVNTHLSPHTDTIRYLFQDVLSHLPQRSIQILLIWKHEGKGKGSPRWYAQQVQSTLSLWKPNSYNVMVTDVLFLLLSNNQPGRLPPITLSPLNATRIHDTLSWNFPSVNILHHQTVLSRGALKKSTPAFSLRYTEWAALLRYCTVNYRLLVLRVGWPLNK